jgi:hypothetical protein
VFDPRRGWTQEVGTSPGPGATPFLDPFRQQYTVNRDLLGNPVPISSNPLVAAVQKLSTMGLQTSQDVVGFASRVATSHEFQEGLRFVGGGVEAISGLFTSLGNPLVGGVMLAHGLDTVNAAGLSLKTGEHVPTLTEQAFGPYVDAGLPWVAGGILGASRLLKLATGAGELGAAAPRGGIDLLQSQRAQIHGPTPPRSPIDIATEARYATRPTPAPLYENRGVNGTYGFRSNTVQNRALQNDLDLAQSLGARDIRVRQLQVDAQGRVVGNNKVDLQFTTRDGMRFYIEYDNLHPPSQNRSLEHYWRILSNDSNANIVLREF